MQLSKGAGLVELIGFNEFEQKNNYKIYKPLLNITKDELENYLKINNHKYFIDESNFDEKYTRNFFRHNFSNPFLENFSSGVKKSFEYLQNDLNSLNIQNNPIKKIEELEIFLNQKDDNLNVRTIDLNLKERGILLSNAQRNEILKQKENYKIYKPLLNITKDELENYLKINNHKYFIDESNFDEKYKRNFFRHNFSNPFLENFSSGVKKSFEYLQNDLNSLDIQNNPIKKIEELEIFLNQKDDNLNIRTIDLSLKKRGILLSSAQRNEILKQKELTISHKINISILENLIWIAPNCNEIMDKKFKELCRIKNIPKNIRNYIFKNNIDLNELIF